MNYDGVSTVLNFIDNGIPMKDKDDDAETPNVLQLKPIRNGTGDCMRVELIGCGKLST